MENPAAFSPEFQYAVKRGVMIAREKGHHELEVEHVLIAVLENRAIESMLRDLGADPYSLKEDLHDFLDRRPQPLNPGTHEQTDRVARDLQLILQEMALSTQYAQSDCKDFILEIMNRPSIRANYYLQQQNVNQRKISRYFSQGRNSVSRDFQNSHNNSKDLAANDEQAENTGNALDSFCTNLNKLAEHGKFKPLIGRDDEVQRTIQTLMRKEKNNPMLVGEAGVGKTAIVEGLAQAIVSGEVPEDMRNATVYSLDLGALVAGTKYRGDFEKRLKTVLAQLNNVPHAILFIDEIHTMIGAGAASGGVMDASNLLKPALARGDLRCIGATTFDEFRENIEKQAALKRRFQKIDVDEPGIEDTIKIVKGVAESYEKHHNVRYAEAALEAAVKLSAQYIHENHFPDKALDVMDEAAAAHKLLPEEERSGEITVREIEKQVAIIAKKPDSNIGGNERELLCSLEDRLKQSIFYQDDAIKEVTQAVKRARTGLSDPDHPLASFLFAGPTGVGKTELTKELGRILGLDVIRFDMSEYMERHTVSKLIGAPPGYVGYDNGGLLTEAIHRNPYSVLLLDEIEKAHPDVYNTLLQVMDNGQLTDNNGKKIDFRNVIIVMTTNAGSFERKKPVIGFNRSQEEEGKAAEKEAIGQSFPPEFRNRLDAVVQFHSLPQEGMLMVVGKVLGELRERIAENTQHPVILKVSEKAAAYLAEKGYDPAMGARPMKRVVKKEIENVLADEILDGDLVHGGTATIDADENGLRFSFTRAAANDDKKDADVANDLLLPAPEAKPPRRNGNDPSP